MIIKMLLVTIVLMGAVTALFAIRIIFRKGGKFPNTHIGGNRNMAKRGIYCASTQDKIASKDKRHILKDTLS
ncbi:hypothetical protein DDZ16_08625 [Marinilabilia rubra]|uniref:Uncharacterized protein n=1 Tax=Marinilabilia rubra TaxID=2162893 RepID=A0A2U2BA93_9BACT|nr:hypothetical protein DDZ16_08625 [Marinilabilia rubra]